MTSDESASRRFAEQLRAKGEWTDEEAKRLIDLLVAEGLTLSVAASRASSMLLIRDCGVDVAID